MDKIRRSIARLDNDDRGAFEQALMGCIVVNTFDWFTPQQLADIRALMVKRRWEWRKRDRAIRSKWAQPRTEEHAA